MENVNLKDNAVVLRFTFTFISDSKNPQYFPFGFQGVFLLNMHPFVHFRPAMH